MAKLKYTSPKGPSLLSVAAIVLYAMTAFAQSARTLVDPLRLSRSPAMSLQRRSSSFLRWPNRSPPGEWRLSNIVRRTCICVGVRRTMLWLSRRASDTFMSESTMPHGCGQMRVVNQSS